MSRHEVTIKQVPGWWPVYYAECACGWTGPSRSANDWRDRVLLDLDKARHASGDCWHCGGTGKCGLLACSLCRHSPAPCAACGASGPGGQP